MTITEPIATLSSHTQRIRSLIRNLGECLRECPALDEQGCVSITQRCNRIPYYTVCGTATGAWSSTSVIAPVASSATPITIQKTGS